MHDHAHVLAPPPALFGAGTAAFLLLHWVFPWPLPFRWPLLWTGIALMTAALALSAWGLITFRRAGTNVNPHQPSLRLVTWGPFALSRNPLYLALTLLFTGLSLTIGTFWGLLILPAILLPLHFGVVLREERYLHQKFGEQYHVYTRQVRRYL